MNWSVFRLKLHHLGPRRLLAHYASRGLKKLIGFECFRAICLTPGDDREVLPAPEGLRCSFVDTERLLREAEDPESGLSAEDFGLALSRGEECFGTFLRDALVSHTWYAPGRAHLTGDVFVRCDPAFAYSRWAYTRPEHRGQRLSAMGKTRALRVLCDRGQRGILSLVSATNVESLRSAATAGCLRVGVIVLARMAGRSIFWVSPGARRVGLVVERQ